MKIPCQKHIFMDEFMLLVGPEDDSDSDCEYVDGADDRSAGSYGCDRW